MFGEIGFRWAGKDPSNLWPRHPLLVRDNFRSPANCIRPLRHGVDSLYLSYPGAIDRQVALMLQELKEAGQSFDDSVQATATYCNPFDEF